MNDSQPHGRHLRGLLFALLAGALFAIAPAWADPPGRIGRIAWLAGTVSLQSASGDAFSAPLNQPLTSGDVLTLDAGARAEIQIGSKTVRLDAGSVLALDRVDDELVRLYLSNGRAIAVLPTPEAFGDFEMATMNGRFTASEPGNYRFAADINGSSATVYSGRLRFAGEGSGLDMRAGVSAQFWQDGQTRSRLLPVLNDEFSAWSVARDQRLAANAQGAYTRYVSPEMTGAADLDAYGSWAETPEYGAIWYPRSVTADWAPYRSGNWVWVAPWGWTWVDYEPWGFAPFHYGRWVQQRGRWAWVPGTRIARPTYAPAMVAWIGGPGGGIAIGSRPTVGWFPLAPHEVYVPSYRSSVNYVRQVNITHVPQLPEAALIVNDPQAFVARAHYAHRELPQAVTVVPAEVVTQRRSVAAAAFPPGDLRALREQPLQAAAPLPAPAAETRIRQDRQAQPGRPAPDIGQRESDRPEVLTVSPGAAVSRSAIAPVPQAQAPASAAPRSEPAAPIRPEAFTPRTGGMPAAGERPEIGAAPSTVIVIPRTEPLESHVQERSFRREEAAPQAVARPPQREVRTEAPAAQVFQAPVARPAMPSAAVPEVRHEAPREVSHAPAAHVEARPSAEAERERAGKEDHRHHDENEKH